VADEDSKVEDGGGRIYFSSTGRTLEVEDEIRLVSVGVDIGSSTSHLVFSRLTLERLDSRYVVASREAFHESEIILTSYVAGEDIDADALGKFIRRQYANAGVTADDIDTGALILTGVAVRRRNARAIGELFAREAGKLVAVSAGDALETTMAAYGSGAVARSIRENATVMNVDVGGGTSKIAVCQGGKVIAQTALDVGARLYMADHPDARAVAERMADDLFDAMAGGGPLKALRLPALSFRGKIDVLTFSGGVSEFIYGREAGDFGDLGKPLAEEILKRARVWGPRLEEPVSRIRATVIGASQYTIQVSGSTIYVSPLDALPLRNVPVIAPDFALDDDEIDRDAIARELAAVLARLDLADGERPVAVFVPWRGSATFARLDAFCRGVVDGLRPVLTRSHPLVLVGDSDIGGLLGIHCREELALANPIVSIDGLDLKEFDYIDIGAMLAESGAVAVVIKSLVFPAS
jgi:ethanolamine utilization protein EutA